MLEIAVNNEVSTKRLDDSKEKGLHLSSVNDHRVLLCAVDPTTNHGKHDLDVADTRQCSDDKEGDELKSEVPFPPGTLGRDFSNELTTNSNDSALNEEKENEDGSSVASNQDLEMVMEELDRAVEEHDDLDADKNNSGKHKMRSRGTKKRKRTPWRSDQSRRKPSKTRPPRSEMSHEDLLKLREKERIAQQLRRERLKRLEESNLVMLKGKTKKTSVSRSFAQVNNKQGNSKPSPSNKSTSEDNKAGESSGDSEAAKGSSALTSPPKCNITEEAKEEDFERELGEVRPVITYESRLSETFDSSLSSASSPTNDKRPWNLGTANPKLNYMSALGLQCNMKIPGDGSAMRTGSFAGFLTSSHSLAPGEGVTSDTATIFELRNPDYDTKVVFSNPEVYGRKRSLSENLAQSCSEESSDSSEKRGFSSAGQAKKLRRSNLSKEELDKLREKERMAKRKQRAKNKKGYSQEDQELFLHDGETDSNESVSSAAKNESPVGIKNESRDGFKEGQLDGVNEHMLEDDCFKEAGMEADMNGQESQLRDDVESNAASPKSGDGKKVKFGRFYDRSLLTAEELESLRRREREYQRRRRARLREEKFKALGEVPPTKKQIDRSPRCDVESKFVDDSNRKYETRMSKGISRPSLRFLEHSSISYFEGEAPDRRDDRERLAALEWGGAVDRSPLNYNCEMSMVHQTGFGSHGLGELRSDLAIPELPPQAPPNDYQYCNGSMDRLILKAESEPSADARKTSQCTSERVVLQTTSNGIIENDRGTAHDFTGENKLIAKESGDNVDIKKPCPGVEKMYPESADMPASAFNRRNPLSEALYASDYKILQENGYRCPKIETDFENRFYELPGNRRIYHSSWVSQCRPCEQEVFTNEENGDHHAEKEFNGDSNEDKSDSNTSSKSAKIVSRNEGNQKWRSWKSGLTDSQLQRRRQSNREAQRRRRMRLRLMQMKSFQEQDQISFDEVMYKRFTPNKRIMVNEAIKAFHASKSKLKNMLEKRQKVFIDAQIEKCKGEMDFKVPCNNTTDMRKNRGCRIKVTPKREVVVPTMGFTRNGDVTSEKAGPINDAMSFQDFQTYPSREPVSYNNSYEQMNLHKEDRDRRSSPPYDGLSPPPSFDDPTHNSSSRKRKQFCPRRLLSEADRRDHDSLQSVVIAQS